MGIYEYYLKCGCKGYWTTYDTNDKGSINKSCSLHELRINNEFKYNLRLFKNRHKAKFITQTYFKVKILDIKNREKYPHNIVKMEVDGLDISQLDNSTKIYFSEFEDDEYEGSSFENIDGKTIIIDVFQTDSIDRSEFEPSSSEPSSS